MVNVVCLIHQMSLVNSQRYQKLCGTHHVAVNKMNTPTERGTTTVTFCRKCGEEGHTQENCVLTKEPCYKCGKLGHIVGEGSQMGRFALRHQIYENPNRETKPFCQKCREEGHWKENCKKAKLLPEKRELLNKYQETYEDLRQRDPITSMDETVTASFPGIIIR